MGDAANSTRLPLRARALRLIEMALVFFVPPTIAAALVDPEQRAGPIFSTLGVDRIITLPVPLRGLVFPSLVIYALPMLIILVRDAGFDRSRLWNARGFVLDAERLLAVFLVGAVVLVGASYAFSLAGILPENGLFRLPREEPTIAKMILLLYPWFSVYPQELSHRVFFFHRYRHALGPAWVAITVNAALFAWLHAVFWNPYALAMTFIGGLLFAWTYLKTRSGFAVTVEHWLFGWWAFMTGAGWFVFAGSVGN